MKLRYALVRWLMHRRPRAIRGSRIDPLARIGAGSQVVDSTIGRYSYCGAECTIIAGDIGQFVSIADGVTIGGARHALEWVSTSPVFHEGRNPFGRVFGSRPAPGFMPTTIGHDVWIGRNAMVASGVTVGTGAAIGMGSVVTRDVAPYAIVAGTPAREVRRRFDQDIVDSLLDLQWWNWDDAKLARHAELFDDPRKLAELAT